MLRCLLFLIVFLLLANGCQPVPGSAPATPDRPAAPRAPEALVMAAMAGWNTDQVSEEQIEVSMAYFSDDATFRIIGFPPQIPAEFVGKEAIRTAYMEWLPLHPRIEVTVEKVEDDVVTAITRYWSDPTRAMAVAPLVGTDVFVVRNGKIVEETWTLREDSRREFAAAFAAGSASPAEGSDGTEPANVTILATGAPLTGANGAMFGPDGLLYIASIGGSEIVAIDPETGEFLKRYAAEQGVLGPDDLAFGPDGSLYWTSLFSGEVGRLSADGVKSGQMVAPGVNPITFSEEGRLFVALDFLGDGLYEVDPGLRQAPRLIVEELGFLNGMDFGPDGLLYGPIYTQGRIVRIDVDAQPASVETVMDGLVTAVAAKFDSQGRLHALDAGTGEIWRIDIPNGKQEVLAQLRPGLDNLAFSVDDRLFVTHNNSGYIWEVLADGSARELVHGGMTGPMGIAVISGQAGETVYTGNVFALYAFDGTTGEIVLDDLPAEAMTLAPLGDKLVATSWFANTVTLLDPSTGAATATYHDFAVPLNAIEFQGDLVVAELGTASVVRTNVENTSQRTVLADGLAVPLGLAASDTDLWVSDLGAGIVWQIVADGQVLAEPRAVAQGLNAPSGLAVTTDGRLLVVEVGQSRLLAIDPETGETSPVAEGLAVADTGPAGAPPILAGVAGGASGHIYVAGAAERVLYRIEP